MISLNILQPCLSCGAQAVVALLVVLLVWSCLIQFGTEQTTMAFGVGESGRGDPKTTRLPYSYTLEWDAYQSWRLRWFFCAVVCDGDRSTGASDFCSGPHFTFSQFPFLGFGLLTWWGFLVNTVTTPCLHSFLLVDKGLVCLFSCNTKCWIDHMKSWRGMRQGYLGLPPISPLLDTFG